MQARKAGHLLKSLQSQSKRSKRVRKTHDEVLEILSKFEELVEDQLMKALDISPQDGESYLDLSHAYSLLADCQTALNWEYCWEKSIEATQKAASIVPKSLSARDWDLLGSYHAAERRHEKAIDCYQQAVRLEPENGAHHLWLGTEYEELKDYRRAIDSYRRALNSQFEHDEHRLATRYRLARLSKICGHKEFLLYRATKGHNDPPLDEPPQSELFRADLKRLREELQEED